MSRGSFRVTLNLESMEKFFFWARTTLLQFSVGWLCLTSQVKHHFLLPVVLQQQAEVVQLVYTGGQPAKAIQ